MTAARVPSRTTGLPGARPMLASTGAPPRGAGWAFEFAWDGLRCLAHARGGALRLMTDAGRDVTPHFPELDVPATGAAGQGLVLDGVVVALDAVGRPNARRLRRRQRVARPSAALAAQVPVSYYVFDVLEVDGTSALRLPYHRRRELLVTLDLAGSKVVVPPSFTGVPADAVVATARHYGLDGIVAKRLESTYQSGRRSRSWIETAVQREQDVVVGGWVPGPRGGTGIGSLLVGVPDEGGLRYAGRVSTGVTAGARRELSDAAAGLETARCPFVAGLPDELAGGGHWLAPRLVGRVEHRRWTASGLLERPTWRGLRVGTHPATVAPPVLSAPVVDTDLALDDLDTTDHPPVRPTPPEPEPIPAAGTEPAGPAVGAEQVEAALRSRFSAHFVHNTLTAIASYVRTDPDRARDLLTEFSDFTRYSFRSGGAPSTVAEELHNAERYLTLERARFGTRLRTEVSHAADVGSVALPPFVIAPLVENAVRHGIEPVPGGGTVSVVASGAGADCIITISDDGAGMEPGGAPPTMGVRGGVAEVSRRLRAAYGGDCDLNVDTRPGAGTAVRIRVPARARTRELAG